MTDDIPMVEPIGIPEYKHKNSKYDMMPALPARMLAVASSTGGKSVLIANLILEISRGSVEKREIYIYIHTYIYIFIYLFIYLLIYLPFHVYDTWRAVKNT